MQYHLMVMLVFYLPLIFGWSCCSRRHTVQFNTFHKICILILHLDLCELLLFKQFSVQKSPTKATIFAFLTSL